MSKHRTNRITEILRFLERKIDAGAGDERYFFAEGRYTIRVANDMESRQQAYRLVYELYREKEYAGFHQSKMWLSIFDALPKTTTLLVERTTDGKLVGTVTAIPDSPMGLPADALYGQELDELRNAGRQLTEVVSLANCGEEGGTSVVAALVNYVCIVGQQIHKSSDFVITVNPRHVGFYQRMMLFEGLGTERDYEKVGGAPAALMRLDFAVRSKAVNREHDRDRENSRRRSIYHLAPRPENEGTIAKLFRRSLRPMSERELRYFFVKRTSLLAEAPASARSYLQDSYLAYDWERILGERAGTRSLEAVR